MSTGDPMWPCGHINWGFDLAGKVLTECGLCNPSKTTTYLLSEPKQLDEMPPPPPTIPVTPKPDSAGSMFRLSEQEMAGASYHYAISQYKAYRELCKKHSFTMTFLHDEITFDGPEENREAFLKEWGELIKKRTEELTKDIVEKYRSAYGEVPFDIPIHPHAREWSDPLTGKFDTRSPPRAGQIPRRTKKEKEQLFNSLYGGSMTGRLSVKDTPKSSSYPRELNEPLCEGCARELFLHRRDVENIEWRAYHIIPEEGSEYYCRREAYYLTRTTLEAYQAWAREQARKKGYVPILNGRRRFLADDKHFVREVLGQFVEPEKPILYKKSRAVGKSTELGDWLLATIEDPELIRQFQTAQRFADKKLAANGKEFLKNNPDASAAWSASLRRRIAKSEEADRKRKENESIPWDPYGDWED